LDRFAAQEPDQKHAGIGRTRAKKQSLVLAIDFDD
jgi:hypothetical protein